MDTSELLKQLRIDRDGGRLRTPEALLFELDRDGRIARVDVFVCSRPAR